MQRFIYSFPGGNLAEPVHAGTDADAAFVDRALAGAQRAVVGHLAWLGAAIFAGKDDERVVADSIFTDGG